MKRAAMLGGAVLAAAIPNLTAAQPPTVSASAAPLAFAPPLDRPATYKVITRKRGRDGEMIGFIFVYALDWQRVGRGFQLSATLQHIDSDARPEMVKALTGLVAPLVGETVTYLVAPDGSRIDLVDPDALWARVAERTEALGTAAQRPEARQMARLLAALPPADRERLATADIRALVAPADAALAGGSPAAAGRTVIDAGAGRQTVTEVEQAVLPAAAGGQPLRIETARTVDTATGLVVNERRRSWIIDPTSGASTLVEERIRELDGGE